MFIFKDVYDLANRVGCPIVDRNATDSWDFDGKTIASYYTPNKFASSEFCAEYGIDQNKVVYFTEHDLFHETLHYLVAEECQRDLPEYGLTANLTGSGAFGPLGGEFRKANGVLTDAAWPYRGLVDHHDQEAQEIACWILTCKLGPMFGLSPHLSAEKDGGFQSWNQYRKVKHNQMLDSSSSIRRLARQYARRGMRELQKRLGNNG